MNAAFDFLALVILLMAVLVPVPAQIALRSVIRTSISVSKSGISNTGRLAAVLYYAMCAVLTFCTAGFLWFDAARAGCEVLIAVLCLGLIATDARWFWLPLPWTLAMFSSGLALAATDGILIERIGAAAAVVASLETLRFAFRRWRNTEALGGGDVILGAAIATHIGLMETGMVFTVAACGALLFSLVLKNSSGAAKTPLGTWLSIAFLPGLMGLSYF